MLVRTNIKIIVFSLHMSLYLNRFHTEKPILIFNIRDEDGHVETELYTSVHLVLENFNNPKYTISE